MKSLRVLAILITCLVLPVTKVISQTMPTVKFREGNVWVTGLTSQTVQDLSDVSQEEWFTILRVYTNDAFVQKIDQPITGSYTWYGDSLSFNPNFSFVAGQRYHTVFDCSALLKRSGNKSTGVHTVELSFRIPKEQFSPTFVEAVHPQAEVLPENMLRMYISFSQPMMPGEAYEHISLIKEDGTPVDKAFLIIDHELWDAERKRFTLLFDPGRIKRGIQSQTDLGAPLQAGQAYRLIIDPAWRDVNGNALAERYAKSFTVSAAKRSKLDIQLWKITTPTAGTKDDLLIEFDRPMDYSLALKDITITSVQAGNVKGEVSFMNSRYWRFTPDQPWPHDQYFVTVNSLLEDVAGNNLNNAFDIDLTREKRINSTKPVKRAFFVKPLMK